MAQLPGLLLEPLISMFVFLFLAVSARGGLQERPVDSDMPILIELMIWLII